MIEWRQLSNLIRAHLMEIIREPGVLFWGIVFPILMSLGLGIAFTKKPDLLIRAAIIIPETSKPAGTKNYVFDSIISNHSGFLTDDKNNPNILVPDDLLGNTSIVFQKTTWEEAMVQLKRGYLNIIIDEKDGQLQYHFDPVNPDAQLSYMKLTGVLGYKENVVKQSSGLVAPLTVTGTRYIDFLIPGLVAMGVMMACMWGISYGIIDKRSKKLLRRMVATPMKKSHFLISLIAVRILMNFIESGLLVLFAWWAFDISIQGNFWALLVLFIGGNVAFSGLAIFISSRTANTEIGNGLINAIVMPMMVLSGIFFSYRNFPDWAIPWIRKLPLTLLADGIRSLFIEGAGFSHLIIPILVMYAIGIVFFTLGLKIFKWY
jgi:ABC-type multidrug transport system permease subunit